MLTAIKAAKFKQVRRTLLAIGCASGALCAASPAMASCVIAPGGTGTVANPGPNSTVVCTGITTGISVAGTNSASAVQIEGGSEVNGVASSEIRLDGTGVSVTIGDGATPGPAILRDISVLLIGDNAQLDIVGGSLVDQSGNSSALIFVDGQFASINIGSGSQVTVSRAVQVHGSSASITLSSGATLSASSGFTNSALIYGGTTSQNFYINGRIETLGANPIETIIDAGDGDDLIALTNSTRFATGAFATTTPVFLLYGGDGIDTLHLDNIHQSLNFNSQAFERLYVDGGIGGISRIRGTHEFQDITIQRGQLDVFGVAALGSTGSLVNILADGRMRFFDNGSGLLTQQFAGSGVLEYHGGSHEFGSANTFSGQFIIVGGAPIISHSNAFGTATVSNFADVILRDVHITNTLTGNGNYIIAGTQTSLDAVNAMRGNIVIRSGRLLVSNVAALGNGQGVAPAAIVIDPGARLTLDISGNATLDNALSGSGTLEKLLAGNLTINRSNASFTGQVNLLGGRTFVNADNALGTGVIFINAALNPGDVIIANALSGSGAIEKNGSGVTQLLGNNSNFSGILIGNAGTIRVTSGTGLGTANIILSNAATLQLDLAAGTTTSANAVTGGGTIRKTGAGQINFINPLTVGNFALDAGRARINTVLTGNVNVASGASLDGTGRIIGNLTNNGTVAPGNSIGTLTVQGNYVHNSGSVLEIEFDANGNIDLLAVTGTATLNGGTLRFVSLGGAEGAGGTFLTATGGVTGTFASVQTVGAQLPLAVIYQTNSAIMAPSVLTARPSTFNAQFLAAADNAFNFVDMLPSTADAGPSGKRLWIQGYGSDGNRSASGTTLGYSHEGYGMAGGIVLPLSDTITLGAAVGWNHGKIGLDAGGGSGEQSAVLGSVHLGYSGAGFALEGGVVYGGVDQETLRNVSFNGFSASVDGGTNSAVYGGYLGARADLAKLGGWNLSARLRGSLIHQSQEGFTESGSSPLRLAVPDLSSDTLQAQGGLGLSRKIGSGQLRFELGARLTDNLGDRAIPVAFAASAAGVTLQGDTRGSVDGFASAALDLPLTDNVRLTVGYAGQVGQSDRHEGRIGLSIGF